MAKVGFDWPDLQGPRSKLDEEVAELDEAVRAGEPQAVSGFTPKCLARLQMLKSTSPSSSETALADAADRFQQRFQKVEAAMDYDLSGRDLAELEAAWQQAKRDLAP